MAHWCLAGPLAFFVGCVFVIAPQFAEHIEGFLHLENQLYPYLDWAIAIQGGNGGDNVVFCKFYRQFGSIGIRVVKLDNWMFIY